MMRSVRLFGIGLHDFNFMMLCRCDVAICLGVDFIDVSCLGLVDIVGIVFKDCRWDSMMDENNKYFEYAQQELSTMSHVWHSEVW